MRHLTYSTSMNPWGYVYYKAQFSVNLKCFKLAGPSSHSVQQYDERKNFLTKFAASQSGRL